MARSSLSRPVVPDITGSSIDRRQRGYERHRPEETLLYKLVAEHLETFLAESREKHDRPLPTYVERELRAYLRCGILAHRFSVDAVYTSPTGLPEYDATHRGDVVRCAFDRTLTTDELETVAAHGFNGLADAGERHDLHRFDAHSLEL